MQLIRKNGSSLYYTTYGTGEPIFLLHHGFGSTAMWDGIHPGLTEQGFQVILFDRRGYGQSEMDPDFFNYYSSDRYRPESVTELETLRQTLGLERINIVGQCEGGVVALDYAVQYPQHTNSVVISSTLCHSHVPMREFNNKAFPKTFKEKHPSYKAKFIEWHSLEKAEILYDHFRIFGGTYGREFFDIRDKLPDIKSPVLILYPDRSSLFEVEQAVDFYRNIERAELTVLPDCGHNTYEQQPEEYIRHASTFVRKHSGTHE
ncbi:MAG: alpha/beta fold hydrolase [Proteobacteria bacterium]|nr:alpha/beta fold hydrolase [Pseudomonadota bacterium]